jgi:hypothetical protein
MPMSSHVLTINFQRIHSSRGMPSRQKNPFGMTARWYQDNASTWEHKPQVCNLFPTPLNDSPQAL